MDNSNFFKDLSQSISDYRNIVLLIFLTEDDRNLLKRIGFSKNDIILLNLEFKEFLIEGYEEYLDHVKNEEESVIENFLGG